MMPGPGASQPDNDLSRIHRIGEDPVNLDDHLNLPVFNVNDGLNEQEQIDHMVNHFFQKGENLSFHMDTNLSGSFENIDKLFPNIWYIHLNPRY